MSLTVNPVSHVSFRAQEDVSSKSVEEILSRPGMWAKPEEALTPQKAPKKHSFLKFVAGALITVGVVAGALYGLKTRWPKVFDAAKNLEGLKGFEKFKGLASKWVGKGGEFVESAVTKTGAFKDNWEKLMKFVKREKA